MTATHGARRIVAWVAGTLVVAMAGLYVASLLGFSLFPSKQSETALLNSIQDTGNYVAAVGDFEVVVDDKDESALPDFIPEVIAGRRTVFVGAGTVNAYVDLSDITAGDLMLSADGKTVNVRLPEAELEKPNLDQERSGLVSQKRGVLDQISDILEVQDQARFYKLAESKIAAAAKKSELQQRATQNTKAMLTAMFGPLGLEVTFRSDVR